MNTAVQIEDRLEAFKQRRASQQHEKRDKMKNEIDRDHSNASENRNKNMEKLKKKVETHLNRVKDVR